MADSALFTSTGPSGGGMQRGGFDALQELTRHGYVPDPDARTEGDGLLLRNRTAPDLVLRPNGVIQIPPGQPLKRALTDVGPEPRQKRRWGRMFLIIVGLVIYTLIAIAIVAGLMEG